jgi:putative transcriptional regulator
VESLRGQILLAEPRLADPNFQRTVVLITEHTDDGAMGLVLNRRSPTTVGEAAPELTAVADAEEPIHVGGPVQPAAIMVLAEFDDPQAAAVVVLADVGFLPAGGDLGAAGEVTRRARTFAGYSGWGPGQLESELESGGWIVESDPAPDDLFTHQPDELWGTILTRKGGRFALLARMPLDPSVN